MKTITVLELRHHAEAAVVFLASGFVTGIDLRVDGGFLSQTI